MQGSLQRKGDILEATEESFDQVGWHQLKGNLLLTQLAANWMIGQKKSDPDFGGCIINVSSIFCHGGLG